MSWDEYCNGPKSGCGKETFTLEGHQIRVEFEWSLEVEEDVEEDFDEDTGRKHYSVCKRAITEISLGNIWIDGELDEEDGILEILGQDGYDELKELAKEAI
jgi:hypothetical protein